MATQVHLSANPVSATPVSVTPSLTHTATPQQVEQRRAVRGYILFTLVVLLGLALAWRLREVLKQGSGIVPVQEVLADVDPKLEELRGAEEAEEPGEDLEATEASTESEEEE